MNSVNRMLMSANGEVRLRFDKNCRNIIKSMEQTMYKEGSPEIDKRPGMEHMSDALGYPIEYKFPIKKTNFVGANLS